MGINAFFGAQFGGTAPLGTGSHIQRSPCGLESPRVVAPLGPVLGEQRCSGTRACVRKCTDAEVGAREERDRAAVARGERARLPLAVELGGRARDTVGQVGAAHQHRGDARDEALRLVEVAVGRHAAIGRQNKPVRISIYARAVPVISVALLYS